MSDNRLQIRGYDKWLKFNILSVLLLAVYQMVYPIYPVYWETFYHFYYVLWLIVLLTFYFFYRGVSGGIETKIFLLWCLWLYITRLLNGNLSLNDDFRMILGLYSGILFLTAGQILDKDGRLKMFDILSAAVGVYFTVLGVIGIICTLRGGAFINPLNGELLCYFNTRLFYYEANTNIVSAWFYISICLLIFSFIRHKKLAWRIGTAAAIFICHVCLALTKSRSMKLAFAITVALLVVFIVFEKLSITKLRKKIALGLAVAAVTAPLAFLSLNADTLLVSAAASVVRSDMEEVSETEAADEAQKQTLGIVDNRDLFVDTGRLPIYRGALVTIQRNPLCLIRGTTEEDVMSICNEYLKEYYISIGRTVKAESKGMAHFHNSFIQTLIWTGVVGLLCMVSFMLCIAGKALKLCFEDRLKVSLCEKAMLLPMLGLALYNLLETNLFWDIDIRAIMFLIPAGMASGIYRDAVNNQSTK